MGYETNVTVPSVAWTPRKCQIFRLVCRQQVLRQEVSRNVLQIAVIWVKSIVPPVNLGVGGFHQG